MVVDDGADGKGNYGLYRIGCDFGRFLHNVASLFFTSSRHEPVAPKHYFSGRSIHGMEKATTSANLQCYVLGYLPEVMVAGSSSDDKRSFGRELS
jgi:hypothetical protein